MRITVQNVFKYRVGCKGVDRFLISKQTISVVKFLNS